jgi:MFS family permease
VALAVLFSLENPEPARPPDFRVYLGQVWKAMASRRVLALFVVGVLTFIIIYGPYMTFFPLWLASAFAVAPFAVGMMMSVSSVATALTASQAARLAAAFSERSLIGASCVLYGVALVAIPLMPNLWLLTIPVSILGVAQGMNMPSLMTLLAGECPMEQRGALMSVNGMVLRLGQTLGPLVMGALFVASGFGGVFLGGAVCAALMLMAVLAVMR